MLNEDKNYTGAVLYVDIRALNTEQYADLMLHGLDKELGISDLHKKGRIGPRPAGEVQGIVGTDKILVPWKAVIRVELSENPTLLSALFLYQLSADIEHYVVDMHIFGRYLVWPYLVFGDKLIQEVLLRAKEQNVPVDEFNPGNYLDNFIFEKPYYPARVPVERLSLKKATEKVAQLLREHKYLTTDEIRMFTGYGPGRVIPPLRRKGMVIDRVKYTQGNFKYILKKDIEE